MSIVVKIDGEVGVGKTSLALTFPKPIIHMSTDVGGFERAAWRFQEDIKSEAIISRPYHIPQQAILDKLLGTAKQAKKLVGMRDLWYGRLLKDYVAALSDPSVATVIWDSWTQTWPLCTSTYLEELQETNPSRTNLMEVEYTNPNIRMGSLIDAAKENGKNLVLVCHMADERKDHIDPSTGKKESVLTGKRIADCWKRTDRVVDMIISVELSSNKPKATIMQSKLVLDLTGMVYDDPSWQSIETAVKMLRGE